jgi:uncharacterized protein (TIGR03067 family)
MKFRVLTALAVGLVGVAELGAIVDRPPRRKEATAKAMHGLQGRWQLLAVRVHACDPARAVLKAQLVFPHVEIKGKQFMSRDEDGQTPFRFRVHGAKNPRAIDFFPEGSPSGPVIRCIFVLQGDTLKLCQATDGKGRPDDFNSKTGREIITLTWKRIKG